MSSSTNHISLNVESAPTNAEDPHPPPPANENTQSLTESRLQKKQKTDNEPKPYVTPMEEPFKFAPEKPDVDPWETLLEPLLKKERAQCELWKDEVQNLLIFAGLFSAVVTAFIIESYKTLQEDPQDVMVSILSQILVRLDNSSADSPIPSAQSSFIPSQSAERINTFWFISLVLSIATALIGIISLQWLRVYQSYPDPENWEQNFAIFNMRKEGLEAWHVPKVFTALPLLLQAALVLFLAGMIDFSLFQLGNRVAIPVLVFVGLVLLFILATTTMAAFHCSFLYFWGSKNRDPLYVPSQCPYKSPQALAFFAILHFLHKIAQYVNPRKIFIMPGGLSKVVIRRLWYEANWDMYDQVWLSLRHSISQEIFDQHQPHSDFINPLFYFPRKQYLTDALSGLRKYGLMQSEVTEEAAYHCITSILQDISKDISHLDIASDIVGRSISSCQNSCGRYIQGLVIGDIPKTYQTPITDYLDLRPADVVDPYVFHYQNIIAFFGKDGIDYSTDRLRNYIQEIKIRFQEWLYSHPRHVFPSEMAKDDGGIPASVAKLLHVLIPTSSWWPKYLEPDVIQMKREIVRQYSRVFIKYFECIANNPTHNWESDIHTAAIVGNLFSEIVMIDSIEDLDSMSTTMSNIIVNHLKFLPEDSTSGISSNTLLCYAGALFLDAFPCDLPEDDTNMRSIYSKLQQAHTVILGYKKVLFDIRGPDALLEDRFKGWRTSADSMVERFSDEWWATLGNSFLPTIIEQQPPVPVNFETENVMAKSHIQDAS